MRGHPSNLAGQKFDKLLVLSATEKTKSGTKWLCQCDCGNQIQKLTTQLIRPSHTGCGDCESISRSKSSSFRTHGECELGKTKLYMVWKGMISRCRDKGNTSYPWYGGKGISVCLDWFDFPVFNEWEIANGYKQGLVIDRINSMENYNYKNCQFITASENSRRMIDSRKHRVAA